MDPTKYIAHCVNNIAGMMLLGKSYSWDDKTVTDLTQNLDEVVKHVAFGGPLNFMPLLRYVNGLEPKHENFKCEFSSFIPTFKKSLASLKKSLHVIRDIQKKLIKECQESTSSSKIEVPSNLIQAFLLQMSKGSPEHIYNHDQLRCLLFDLYVAITETVKTCFRWILLYLAQYEEVQNKVRQELLEVETDDFADLHYTKATLAEVARIRTVVPIGVPQLVSENICVEGFAIPKDAVIMPMLWAIHMDPKVYEEPEEFRPERFLNNDGKFFRPESYLPFQTGKTKNA